MATLTVPGSGPATPASGGRQVAACELLLVALEEEHRVALAWLEKRHSALRDAVERACQKFGLDVEGAGVESSMLHSEQPSVSPFPSEFGTTSGPALKQRASPNLNGQEQLQQFCEDGMAEQEQTPDEQRCDDAVPSNSLNGRTDPSPRAASSPSVAGSPTMEQDTDAPRTPRASNENTGQKSLTLGIGDDISVVSSRSGSKGKPRMQRSNSSVNKQSSKFISTLTNTKQLVSTEAAGASIRGRLDRLLKNTLFDLSIGCLIVVNTILMLLQLELEPPDPSLTVILEDNPHQIFEWCGHIFNVVFFAELVLRVYVKRLAFFCSPFNWVDMVIVLATTVDAYILSQISSNRQNISFMRMVRFVRVVRALRVIRTMSLFRQLRVLLNTIAMSFMSLVWSMIILFIFMMMFSLLLCQMLQPFVVDPDNKQTMRDWVFRYYGTSSRSLYTVFEVTFSGGWPTYARPLVEDVSPVYAAFFVVYITAVVFAMVRIISALFLKDTLQTAANDADMMVHEKMKEIKSFMGKLSELFDQADTSGDGRLNKEELDAIMAFPKVRVWMNVIGLDVSETDCLFDLLNNDGEITKEEFVKGIIRLKGAPRSQDTIAIMKDMERIRAQCAGMHDTLENTRKASEATLRASEQAFQHQRQYLEDARRAGLSVGAPLDPDRTSTGKHQL